MANSKVLLAVIVIAQLFLTSCAPSVQTQVTRPAEINLVGIKRIAMGSIDGEFGGALSDILTQKLFDSGRYDVVDRQHINTLMREHNLNLSGAVDEKSSVEIGKLLGTSALIFGSSSGKFGQRLETNQYKNKDGSSYTKYTKYGEGTINTTLKVVDLQTGKIIAVKNFTDKDYDTNTEENKLPDNLDKDAVMGRILNTTANKFAKMIAPYTEYVRVEFEDSKIPEVKSGIVMAQSGQWDSANVQFKNAVDANPNDSAAWYNLGLSYMYTLRFDEAVQAFNKSNVLHPSPKTAKELVNCNNMRADKRKLDSQMGN